MPSVEELGRLVKAKYPKKYNDLSDLEVGRLVKAKYPAAYSDFTESKVSVINPYTLQVSPPPNPLQQQIAELQRYYHPNNGRIISWWRALKSGTRVRQLEILNREQELVLEGAAKLAEAVNAKERGEIEYNRFVAENAVALLSLKHQARLIEDAIANGLSVEKHDEVKAAKLLSEAEIEKHRHISAIDLQNHREMSNINLENRKKQLKQDLVNRDAQIKQDLSTRTKIMR